MNNIHVIIMIIIVVNLVHSFKNVSALLKRGSLFYTFGVFTENVTHELNSNKIIFGRSQGVTWHVSGF